jgi:hypothetical protein
MPAASTPLFILGHGLESIYQIYQQEGDALALALATPPPEV